MTDTNDRYAVVEKLMAMRPGETKLVKREEVLDIIPVHWREEFREGVPTEGQWFCNFVEGFSDGQLRCGEQFLTGDIVVEKLSRSDHLA